MLEWYVNQISYGGVYNGVEAAAQGYFGKAAKDLTLAEAAMLAGIPQSPAEYDPVNHPESAKARRNEILDLMVRQRPHPDRRGHVLHADGGGGCCGEGGGHQHLREALPDPGAALRAAVRAAELEQILGSRDTWFAAGLTVTTSLDIDMQDEFQQIMEDAITAKPVGPTRPTRDLQTATTAR